MSNTLANLSHEQLLTLMPPAVRVREFIRQQEDGEQALLDRSEYNKANAGGLDLNSFDPAKINDLSDETLRQIIYQVYGEKNSLLTREDLLEIGAAALDDAISQ